MNDTDELKESAGVQNVFSAVCIAKRDWSRKLLTEKKVLLLRTLKLTIIPEANIRSKYKASIVLEGPLERHYKYSHYLKSSPGTVCSSKNRGSSMRISNVWSKE